MDRMFSCGYCPRVDRPTRVLETVSKLIDLIFANVYESNIVG